MSAPARICRKRSALRRRSREARIDDDHLRVALQLGFNRPFEAARVVLGRIAAHDQHHVGVLDVDPAVGHRAASECGPQTGDRWPVSNPGLRFEIADPQAAHGLDGEKIQFVGVGAAAGPANPLAAIDRVAVLVFLDERLVAGLLVQRAISLIGSVPGDVFPMSREPGRRTCGFSRRRSLRMSCSSEAPFGQSVPRLIG